MSSLWQLLSQQQYNLKIWVNTNLMRLYELYKSPYAGLLAAVVFTANADKHKAIMVFNKTIQQRAQIPQPSSARIRPHHPYSLVPDVLI